MLDNLDRRTQSTRAEPDRFSNQWYRAGIYGSIVMLVYAISIIGYFGLSDATLVDPIQTVYPGVWFGVLVAGFVLIPSRTEGSMKGLVVSIGFVIWLLVVSGLLDIGATRSGITVEMAMPGWGPVILLALFGGSLTIIPFQIAGYVGLGAFLYRTIGRAPKSVLPGVLSVFSCAGCLGWIGIALIGASGFSSAWLLDYSYPVATIAFIATVGLFRYFSVGSEQRSV